MSFSHCFFTINEKMELYNTIKSTLSNKTEVNMFNSFIFLDQFANSNFHICIIAFIEKFTHRRPTNMIYIITHETRSKESSPISSRRKYWTSKKRYKRTNESYPCSDCIGKMMECITCYSSTLKTLAYCKSTNKKSSLENHNSKQNPECPECRNPDIRIAYSRNST